MFGFFLNRIEAIYRIEVKRKKKSHSLLIPFLLIEWKTNWISRQFKMYPSLCVFTEVHKHCNHRMVRGLGFPLSSSPGGVDKQQSNHRISDHGMEGVTQRTAVVSPKQLKLTIWKTGKKKIFSVNKKTTKSNRRLCSCYPKHLCRMELYGLFSSFAKSTNEQKALSQRI